VAPPPSERDALVASDHRALRGHVGTEIASTHDSTRREEVYAMRALILYMLGVPVFLIVILWLFGVV
jgi:hypothetical protein